MVRKKGKEKGINQVMRVIKIERHKMIINENDFTLFLLFFYVGLGEKNGALFLFLLIFLFL